MLNPGDTLLIARERLRVEATSPRVKLRSLSCPGILRYPTLAFVEREGQVVEREGQSEELVTAAPRFYTFTGPELTQLLTDGIDLFLEYRDKHGREEADARTIAPFEALLGLDAEDELYRMGECATSHVREGEPVSLLGRLEGERQS